MKNGAFIPAEILEREDLPPPIKLVYGRVSVLIGKGESAVLTTDELARQCGLSRRQAAKALPYLAELKLVQPHESLAGHGLLRVFRKVQPEPPQDKSPAKKQ